MVLKGTENDNHSEINPQSFLFRG